MTVDQCKIAKNDEAVISAGSTLLVNRWQCWPLRSDVISRNSHDLFMRFAAAAAPAALTKIGRAGHHYHLW